MRTTTQRTTYTMRIDLDGNVQVTKHTPSPYGPQAEHFGAFETQDDARDAINADIEATGAPSLVIWAE